MDKILNSLVYKTLFYVNIYGSYKLLKQSGFLAHPVYQLVSVSNSSIDYVDFKVPGDATSQLDPHTVDVFIMQCGLRQHVTGTTHARVGARASPVCIYCSPVADIIAQHGVQYHQYADNTQLHLAMRADNTSAGCPFSPSVPPTPDSGTCRTVYSVTACGDVLRVFRAACVRGRSWSAIVAAGNGARSTSDVPQARLDGGMIVQLPRTGQPTHSAPADYELAQTLACSLILSKIDYCNAVLHGAPNYNIKKLQRVQNNAARIVLQQPRRSHAKPLLKMLHLPARSAADRL